MSCIRFLGVIAVSILCGVPNAQAQWVETSTVSLSVNFLRLKDVENERKRFPRDFLSPRSGGHTHVDIGVKWSLEEKARTDPNKFYEWAVMYSCRSHHNTGNRPNTFNEVNHCLGITKYFDTRMLGIRPYLMYLHVDENSRDGKMKIRGGGGENCPISGPYFDACIGLTYGWVGYEDARRGRRVHKRLKIPHVAFQKGQNAIVFQPLGGDDYGIYFRHKF